MKIHQPFNKSSTFRRSIKPRRKIILCHSSPHHSCGVFWKVLDKRGVTLIELLVAFVICALVIAGVYRIFIAQTKAYTIQDQVVEVQQNIRNAMEMMVRDIRMAGFDYDNSTSPKTIGANPLVVGASTITVEYEYNNNGVSKIYRETYRLNGNNLEKQHSEDGGAVSTEVLLENVDALEFTCGTDGKILDYSKQDGEVDSWIPCGNVVNGSDKVIAVRVVLTARPTPVNPDVQTMVSPRTLTSTVVLRNFSMKQM